MAEGTSKARLFSYFSFPKGPTGRAIQRTVKEVRLSVAGTDLTQYVQKTKLLVKPELIPFSQKAVPSVTGQGYFQLKVELMGPSDILLPIAKHEQVDLVVDGKARTVRLSDWSVGVQMKRATWLGLTFVWQEVLQN